MVYEVESAGSSPEVVPSTPLSVHAASKSTSGVSHGSRVVGGQPARPRMGVIERSTGFIGHRVMSCAGEPTTCCAKGLAES